MALFLFYSLVGLTCGFSCVIVIDLIIVHVSKRNGIFWDIKKEDE